MLKIFYLYPNLSQKYQRLSLLSVMTYLRSKLLQPADLLDKNVDLKKVNATIQVLNEQALAMNQYVALYQKRLYEAKKKNRDIVTNLFKQATRDHKLFNDTDTEVTLAY